MIDPQNFTDTRASYPGQALGGLKHQVQSWTPSLRVLTFSMMLAVAVLPIAVLYNWVGRTAFDNELKRVDESHLIIAKNLSSTLSRYAADSIAVFESALADQIDDNGYAKLLGKFDICKVMFFGPDNAVVSQIGGGHMHSADMPSPEVLRELRALTAQKPGETVVSGIRPMENGAHFFITQLREDGTLAVAPWSAGYIRTLQKSVAFGELGHSMMVDQDGLVIAHPNADWERSSKDASKLSVVQQMMSGKSGVMQFYSPPMDAQMIAGFTQVPETGWGVMVPQPIRELEARADLLQGAALYVSGLGIALAVLVGLWFSKLLSAPIVSLASSALRIAKGDFAARVDHMPRYTPSEIGGLSQCFDEMAGDIERKNRQLTQKLRVEKELSEERAGLLADAQRAYAVKSQFMSTISHELRTPLTSIRGSVDLVLSGRLGDLHPKVESMLTIGKRNTERLLLLVNDILDFSSLEADQMPLKIEAVSAAQTLAHALETNAPFSSSATLKFVSHPLKEPFDVWIDHNRIQQVLSNLISNAVKFSGKGTLVELSAETDGDFGVFRVKDHGIGISEEFWPRLFDRFTQEVGSETRHVGGAGLGLAISKAIVEKHGGTMTFETELGKGTTFSFRVPLAQTT